MFWRREKDNPFAHSPIEVARFIVKEADAQGFALTPIKLQKIVFLCHGWMLGLHGMPLVRGPIQAWRYGPVFPDLYHALKHLGAGRVRLSDLPAPRENEEVFDADEVLVMKDTVERYGPLTGGQLVALTHADSSPWHLTRRRAGWRNPEIPDELIEFSYRKILEWCRAHPA